MPGRKQNMNNRRSGICIVLIVLAVLTTMLAGGVIAKYIKENRAGQHTVYAKQFYFTSSMLTEDCAQYTLNSNVESLMFTLGNNEDLLRYSDDNVIYDVTVDNGGLLNLEEDAAKASALHDMPLENGNVTIDNIVLSGLEKGKTYTVTAVGEAGYSKTLSAKFKVLDNGEKIYKHVNDDNEEYVLLTVWTENLTGTAEISVPAGLIPDNTDPVMSNSDYSYKLVTDNGFTKTYSSHTYRFFKEMAGADYTADQFDVIMNGHIADESIPK